MHIYMHTFIISEFTQIPSIYTSIHAHMHTCINKNLKKSCNLSVLKISSKEVPGLENSITSEGFIQTLPYFWRDIGGIDGFFIARFIKN